MHKPLIILMLLVAQGAMAQGRLPPCPASSESPWSNCAGEHIAPSGEKYVGEFLNGERHGQGSYTWPGGDRYVGEFRNQKFHGQGTFTFANGDRYAGEFKDDQFHGKGSFTSAKGDKYVGEFVNQKFNGKGTLTAANGDKYVGEFKDDKFSGQGTLSFSNGETYVGEFKNDKFHGKGTYSFADGGKYIGEFRDGLRNGQGTHSRPNGIEYVGEFSNGKYNGQGTLTFPNGSVGSVAYLANGDKAFSKERVEVFGGGLSASLDDFRRLEWSRKGVRAQKTARLRQEKGHRQAWSAFLEAVHSGGPAPIPYPELLGSAHTALAAARAVETNQPQLLSWSALQTPPGL